MRTQATLNVMDYSLFGTAIDGLSAKQVALALSTQNLSQAQLEEIVIKNDLLAKYGAEELIKNGLLSANSALLVSEKAVNAVELEKRLIKSGVNKEEAKEFIQSNLKIVANGKETSSEVVLTKAIFDDLVARKLLTNEKAEEILQSFGVVAGDFAETASKKGLAKATWELVKAQAAALAFDPTAWIVGGLAVGLGLVALQKKLTKSLEECVEELEEYNSAFESAQNEIKSLDTELDTCTERIKELQKLADDGIITTVEQEELDRLKETNEELDRNLRMQKEKAQLSAIEGVKSADETLSKTVESKYVKTLWYDGVGGYQEIYDSVTPEKELETAISEYNRLSTEIDNLNKSYDSGAISADDYEKELSKLTTQQTDARTRASEMSDILVESEQAYSNLVDVGGELTTTQQSNYDSVSAANNKYDEFLKGINNANNAQSSFVETNNTLRASLEELHKSLDDIQSAYKTVESAIKEYNEHGRLSVDTYQSLMEIEPQYLQYLMDEEGKLRLGTDAMNAYTSALIDNMAKKQMQAIVDYVDGLDAEKRQLYLTKQATDEASESLLDFAAATIHAKFTAGELSEEELTALKGMLANVVAWADFAKKGLSEGGLSSLGSDAKDYIDAYMDFQKASLEKGVIDYETYCSSVSTMLKKMYNDGKISAKDYHDYTKEQLETEKSIYDKAISGMEYIYDKKIQSLNEDKESVENNYQPKIDAIQSEIDALEEANTQRKTAMELEQAQYNLHRALSQKTNKIYTSEQGFVYKADDSSIRDAQDTIADKEHEMAVSELESKIESLEQAMESEIETIDKEIAKYEEYKDKLQDITNAYENAENVKYALAVNGLNNESEILDLRLDELETFEEQYMAIQDDIIKKAYESAQAQYTAITSNSFGDFGGDDIPDPPVSPPLYKVTCDGLLDEKSYTFGNKDKAEAFANSLNEVGYLNRRNWGVQQINEDDKDRKVKQINKFAKGGKNLKEQIAWTQENGAEILLSPARNAILTPISDGDSVLTKAMTENLYKWAELNPITFMPSYSPMNFANLPMRNNTQDISINIGDIQLYGVQNVDDLGNQIVKRLPNVMLQAINRR